MSTRNLSLKNLARQLGVAETLLRSAIEQVVEEKDNREAEQHELMCEGAYKDAMIDEICRIGGSNDETF